MRVKLIDCQKSERPENKQILAYGQYPPLWLNFMQYDSRSVRVYGIYGLSIRKPSIPSSALRSIQAALGVLREFHHTLCQPDLSQSFMLGNSLDILSIVRGVALAVLRRIVIQYLIFYRFIRMTQGRAIQRQIGEVSRDNVHASIGTGHRRFDNGD